MTDFARLPKVAARVAQIDASLKDLKEERERLLDSLGTLEERNYPAGKFILKVFPTRRFNEAQAERNLTPEQFESILKRKPDSALAKAVLTEEEYAATQKTYGMTRQVIPVTDEE